MTLQGIRAIVTGANQGFGLAVAEHFVSEGARVFLCARNEERLRDAAAAVAERAAGGGAVHWTRADVTDPADVDRVTREALSALGGVDTLVCNAGVYGPKG